MSKYAILLNVIDGIRAESRGTPFEAIYLPDRSKLDAINSARARAYIHLFLKVSFGLIDFSEREGSITDGPQDGGVDGYYINREGKVIYLIQSKFRTSAANFESTKISANDLLVMDINRIVGGEIVDERATSYNNRILGLQQAIKEIDDIGRYRYQVIILANVSGLIDAKAKQLTGGFSAQVFNFERAYADLVFPVISGSYFKAQDIQISLDLSNKNSGTKISYEVVTKHHDCEITVLFVPTGEIARIMRRYKNSLLEFNPRSYLELAGHTVNEAIRNTILNNSSNEFALFNNGITILSDETNINEKIGQRNKAQLILRNPQIINGGQTAFTLSRILEEWDDSMPDPFLGKEVLVKVITLSERADGNAQSPEKTNLIELISNASNAQTPVINADKNSNDQEHIEIQKRMFERYGILYERKRGEFADGIHLGYIQPELLIERNLFFRVYYAVVANFDMAIRKRLFLQIRNPLETIANDEVLDNLYYGLLCYKELEKLAPVASRIGRNRRVHLRLYALSRRKPRELSEYPKAAAEAIKNLPGDWSALVRTAKACHPEFCHQQVDPETGEERTRFYQHSWINSRAFMEDVEKYFARIAWEDQDGQDIGELGL